ncbi:MurR/RpiR family transcriptional regulator [Vibrio sp. DW001]|uniref:MurR/RpiR family transcriptional regulator n=1 Tax=Vibrio sp. DW001 TaxID=2912315 RepID=UPI0023B1C405|nr:MurR/RpiR family transcriptional regulator [Vibrio sp. DW001]WED25784.1 MurR/RpiR family transcriptional regulator [Vibrio sp. DW001]
MQDVNAIGAQIRSRLSKLTPLERKVATAIMVDETFDQTTPLKKVALVNGVSEAMIVKITKKLEFTGFRNFRENVARYKQLEIANLHSEIHADDSTVEVLEKVFRTSIQAIEETSSVLDVNALSRAAKVLFSANFICIYGVGGSSSVANDLSHKLLKIGIKSTVYDDSHMMLMSAVIISEDDAVVAISHSGSTKTVIDPSTLAKKNGAKVISLTNYPQSPLVDTSDIVLQSTSQGSHLLGENAAARIAQLNIIDALFVAIAREDIETAEQNYNKTQQAVSHLRMI